MPQTQREVEKPKEQKEAPLVLEQVVPPKLDDALAKIQEASNIEDDEEDELEDSCGCW